MQDISGQQDALTSSDSPTNDTQTRLTDKAVAEGGAYEVIRQRLTQQGKQLQTAISDINQARIDEFGQTDMAVLSRFRVRTEHNCVARDIVCVGPYVLFGYNVFMGLKSSSQVEDVFALYQMHENPEGVEFQAIKHDTSFLSDPNFVKDFQDLYTYFNKVKLLQLVVNETQLLMSFQIGQQLSDIRVFRWQLSPEAPYAAYIDNRGENDITPPAAYDFEWQDTSRDDAIYGRHPHMNILDTLFVETVNGHLTIKVENNTEDGLGIYHEPVEDKNQSLDDASFSYASLGQLIVLKVLPYREKEWRYFVFNKVTLSVTRIDAIDQACIQLPEEHGIIFPGGIYLQNGEQKMFADSLDNMHYQRAIKSPNGEDVLYVFYEPHEGKVALYNYNLINKSLKNPIFGHGYGLLGDGRMVIFYAEGDEGTRIHPMQIWKTPFESDEYSSQQTSSTTFYGRIGNAELVRGISEFNSITKSIAHPETSSSHYEYLVSQTKRLFDAFHWLDSQETQAIHQVLSNIINTSELVLDEYEKVITIQQRSQTLMAEAEEQQTSLLSSLQFESWHEISPFIDGLTALRQQRGHLMSLKDERYIDLERLGTLEQDIVDKQELLSQKTTQFLGSEQALTPYRDTIQDCEAQISHLTTKAELDEPIATLDKIANDLDLVSDLLSSLQSDDASLKIRIVDSLSEVYARLNQVKAKASNQRKQLGADEAQAEFGAQFKLFTQSVAHALAVSDTPESCDEQLSRLLFQLEELESQFSEFDTFLSDILTKRDEVYDTFEAHKQSLMDARQRKAQNLQDAAVRMLSSIQRRTQKTTSLDELNSFFASDPLVLKVHSLIAQLRELMDSVRADDIEAQLKSGHDQAVRSLKDKTEIYEEGGNVIKLGHHRFSVNTQTLDLSIMPRNDELYLHLSGTNYFEKIHNDKLSELKPYWNITVPSESEYIYRAEYLAGLVIHFAQQNKHHLSLEKLQHARTEDQNNHNDAQLLTRVRQITASRFKDGYDKGIHDHDAVKILQQLIPILTDAGTLRFSPLIRAIAIVFWGHYQANATAKHWPERACSAQDMAKLFQQPGALHLLTAEVQQKLQNFLDEHDLPLETDFYPLCAEYLVLELAQDKPSFAQSLRAETLHKQFQQTLESSHVWSQFDQALKRLSQQPKQRWHLVCQWLQAYIHANIPADEQAVFLHYVPEACAWLILETQLSSQSISLALDLTITELLGEHQRVQQSCLHLSLDDFLTRFYHHHHHFIPKYEQFIQLRQQIAESERQRLRLDEFKPKPLSSFVRNQLINTVYLPIIGDNLAKQMGALGDEKRTDLMGLLMMISPPGYGKTTLMEYAANSLGLIFMKINCPSLGHDVLSLDPEQAPNATSKQELIKLNLALEMGNNVMLYLDDIQHTHPEFLQKFISLCDGTRRIEGVWQSKTKTYDMRGKKFCVVMAGNPYTESGELFKIPDMLANRADIYNLGEVLGGNHDAFEMSYIENCLTSNKVLAPLATRDLKDLYRFAEMAQDQTVSNSDFSHDYSAVESQEIVTVLQKLIQVRDVVLKVNQSYIESAAQADKYRVEPPFKLQGSYRNMNKMAEKLSAIMNDDELQQMISDHYLGEAQLLTQGAEENLLKLKSLRQQLSSEEDLRWQQILKDFMRQKQIGGEDSDTGQKVVAQLVDLVSSLEAIKQLISQQAVHQQQSALIQAEAKPSLSPEVLQEIIQSTKSDKQPIVNVVNQPVEGIDELLKTLAFTMENSLVPIVHNMDKKLDIDLGIHRKMHQVSNELKKLAQHMQNPKSASDSTSE